MPTVSVEMKGYNRVQNDLRRTVVLLERELDPMVYKFSQEIRAELKSKPYPPKRPNQTYVRTGNLANRFGVSRQGDARYSINNSAPYGSYVVGNSQGRGQAWMHAGRWWKMRDVVQENVPRLTAAIKREIERIWK